MIPDQWVLAAQAEEVAELRRVLSKVRSETMGDFAGFQGQRNGQSVRVLVTGDGAANAAAAVQELVKRFPPGHVLAVGIAGGLDPELRPGELLVAAVTERAGASLQCPGNWVSRVRQATGCRMGINITASRIAGTPREKASLWQEHGSPSGAWVDLESEIWARALQGAGWDYALMRVISDSADESIPAVVTEAQESNGAVSRRRVALAAMARPSTWRELVGLRERLRRGASVLAQGTAQILDQRPLSWG